MTGPGRVSGISWRPSLVSQLFSWSRKSNSPSSHAPWVPYGKHFPVRVWGMVPLLTQVVNIIICQSKWQSAQSGDVRLLTFTFVTGGFWESDHSGTCSGEKYKWKQNVFWTDRHGLLNWMWLVYAFHNQLDRSCKTCSGASFVILVSF